MNPPGRIPNPRVTVFTPSHDPRFLDDCLATLQAQSCPEWEWIVMLNQGARWEPAAPDPRVRVVSEPQVAGVGMAKRVACADARGEFLVELDHDDELRSDALELIVGAFDEHRDAGFVYSQCAQIDEEGKRDDSRFDEANGWVYQETEVDGRSVLQVDSLAAYPHNVSYIWFAPNHVRAFRRSVYELAGGYDASRDVLDDQDLMCRIYQLAEFHLIPECLYLQRVHHNNTQRVSEINAKIQQETVALYDRYVEHCALAWAERRGLKALDLGAAHNSPPAYLGVDQFPGPNVDIVGDVSHGIDLPDSSCGVIRAVDFLEHVQDKVALFNELYRLLTHGGMLLSLTPSTDGRGAFQDPTHVAYYNENSFWYFTDADYARFVPSIRCRFQVSRLVTYFPSPWHEEHDVPYVCANLIAIKDGPRQGGYLRI
ncbi:MAG TPA: glycosyltransferase [Acidimicrobiales bacterium]|nr:glycosyltransferase [Acidimicrobiales bacterium]